MGISNAVEKISSLNAYLRDPRVKRVMISYYYYRMGGSYKFLSDAFFKWNKEHPSDCIDIMVDSGAFSFMVKEDKLSKINIDEYTVEYGSFVSEYEKYINRFIELDVQSLVGVREYERIYELLDGNTPTHRKPTIVWHVTEDLDKFDRDLIRCKAAGDDLICIGGAAALRITSNRSLGRMMQELCYYAAGKGVHVHGLGITSKVARYVDFYSVDSLSFIYDFINNREAEGVGEGKLRDNYGCYGAAVYSILRGKLMQYYWDLY